MRKPLLLAAAVVALAVGVALVYFPRTSPPPSAPTLPAVRFIDVTAAAGITFRHTNGAAGKKLLPETMGSGVAVLDFDADGWPDLFFVNGRPWPGAPGAPTQALYRNNHDGTFTEVTAAAGLDITLQGMGVAAGDIDNDGFPDLCITAVGGNKLFRNVGGKRFEDITTAAGVAAGAGLTTTGDFEKTSEPLLFPASATFLDYDLDGRLDLFVCNYLTWSPAADLAVQAVLPNGVRAYVPPTQFPGANNLLYRNLGGGKFEDVSALVRVEAAGFDRRVSPVGKALGVVVCDPDSDGWPDLVVACDTVRNLFFRNVAGRFEEAGEACGLAYADGRPRGGMGIDAAELLGAPAVVVANFSNEPSTLFKLTRPSPVMFSDVALPTKLAGQSRAPMKFGAFFFDYDLDGRPDLFTANGHLEPDIAAAQPGQTYPQAAHLYWNTGDPSDLFAAAPADGDLFRPVVGRGCAYLDYDADGDLDLVMTENNGPAKLFRNDNATGNRWLRLEAPVGSEITVEVGGETRKWIVTGARGYLSQSELTVTVGLGRAEAADVVRVRWPRRSGEVQEWRNLRAGATHRLTAVR